MKIYLIIFILLLNPLVTFSDELSDDKNTVLHFDQPQVSLNSLEFNYDDELKPTPNDFQIVEASYLSNNVGERWAIVTFKNTSLGQRFLKNEAIVATFANGDQANSSNLNETLKGNTRLTKAVFFGVHQFPIVSVQVE